MYIERKRANSVEFKGSRLRSASQEDKKDVEQTLAAKRRSVADQDSSPRSFSDFTKDAFSCAKRRALKETAFAPLMQSIQEHFIKVSAKDLLAPNAPTLDVIDFLAYTGIKQGYPKLIDGIVIYLYKQVVVSIDKVDYLWVLAKFARKNLILEKNAGLLMDCEFAETCFLAMDGPWPLRGNTTSLMVGFLAYNFAKIDSSAYDYKGRAITWLLDPDCPQESQSDAIYVLNYLLNRNLLKLDGSDVSTLKSYVIKTLEEESISQLLHRNAMSLFAFILLNDLDLTQINDNLKNQINCFKNDVVLLEPKGRAIGIVGSLISGKQATVDECEVDILTTYALCELQDNSTDVVLQMDIISLLGHFIEGDSIELDSEEIEWLKSYAIKTFTLAIDDEDLIRNFSNFFFMLFERDILRFVESEVIKLSNYVSDILCDRNRSFVDRHNALFVFSCIVEPAEFKGLIDQISEDIIPQFLNEYLEDLTTSPGTLEIQKELLPRMIRFYNLLRDPSDPSIVSLIDKICDLIQAAPLDQSP